MLLALVVLACTVLCQFDDTFGMNVSVGMGSDEQMGNVGG